MSFPQDPPKPLDQTFAPVLDNWLHALQGRMTGGMSPLGQMLAFADWGVHLANAPFRRVALANAAVLQASRLAAAAAGVPAIAADPSDHRFADPAWQQPPFNLFAQAFLLAEEWWARAAGSPRGSSTGSSEKGASTGVATSSQREVAFIIRQLLDMASPSNVPWLNPEVIRDTWTTGGHNLLAGLANLAMDVQHSLGPPDSAPFRLGQDLAATPGKVVLRNDLTELIQYSPVTPDVAKDPILIVPAWIMKYYILDLSPDNSLIGYLVKHGHTVFAISWRNPTAEQSATTLDDYRRLGVMAAVDAVSDICKRARIQACGYCLGGTLLSIAAAAMGRDGDDRLRSVTLFCAQTDFTEAGELQLFITEDQLAFLDDLMRAQGYLDSRQMAGAFQMLRSNDLIWSRSIKSYLLGEAEHSSDLMAWNADGTRMPAAMHSTYLHRLFMDNDLFEGRFPVDGHPIALADIQVPMFVVGTETDHIAPWHSVFKIHLLPEADLTFVLTSGGHNAGVVSPPGHPHRHFRVRQRPAGEHYLGPDEWLAATPPREGSWWPAWLGWLAMHAEGSAAPPPMGSGRFPPLDDAPGRYVREH